jgi:2-dehydro-3-deoxygluconokinase
VVSIGEAMVELAPAGDGLYRRGYAGDTFNTAWHMRQLLGEDADIGFFTRLGTDTFSREFMGQLTADGLDVSLITQDAGRQMGLYLIELDGVERSFHYWRGQSAARLLADDAGALARAMHGKGLIHLSGISLAILSAEARNRLFETVRQARSDGTLVSFDPNIRPRLWSSQDEIRATIGTMLRMTDIALPSFDDERAHWNDASPQDTIRRMRGCGVGEIVVKDGAGPVHAHAAGKAHVCETPGVSTIRDTTGAGDAFNAGYLAARLAGRVPADAIHLAQRLAALVLQHFGARAPKDRVSDLFHLFQG